VLIQLALARKYLCIPATSAPSERVFTDAGLTISNKRASLHTQNAANLIFLHDSLPFVKEMAKLRDELERSNFGEGRLVTQRILYK
jgi:hypothetical protein